MTPDEVKQSITTWCSSDDDLEIASDRFEPGTDFSFGLKAGTLSTAPVDLIVLKADGADRVTIRRSVTLTGDNVDAANRLIASRPGSVTASVERSGADTTVVAQTYVYLDGLSKHTFVQAVAELARTSTLLDAIGGVETASVVDQEAAVRRIRRGRCGCRARTPRLRHGDADAGGLANPRSSPRRLRRSRSRARSRPGSRSGSRCRPPASRRSRYQPAQAQPAYTPQPAAAALPGPAGPGAARAAAGRRRMGAEPLRSTPGTARVGRPGSLWTGGCQPRARLAHPGRRGPRRVGTSDLLERVDRLDRRPDHRRRCLTFVPR